MNLPSIFKKNDVQPQKGISSNVETFVEKEKVPKVIFNDEELHVIVGQWLEVLASKNCSRVGVGASLITQLPADSLLQSGISQDEWAEVDYTFGMLLKQIGIEEKETCLFDDYNKEEFSFNCHFQELNDDAKIRLRWGSLIDDLPAMIIEYKNIVRAYDYHVGNSERPKAITISSFTAKNPENGNKVSTYASPYNANFEVSNADIIMNITVDRPEEIDARGDYIFRLKNDDKLVEYFLDMSFPPNLAEVYKKICEVGIDSVDDYPRFSIKVEKKAENKKAVITDRILVKKGRLCNFILTRNGKKVGIDCQGNTMYEENRFAINKSHGGGLDYHLNVNPNEDINSVGTLPDHVKKAQDEVEEVRLLAKTISGKDI